MLASLDYSEADPCVKNKWREVPTINSRGYPAWWHVKHYWLHRRWGRCLNRQKFVFVRSSYKAAYYIDRIPYRGRVSEIKPYITLVLSKRMTCPGGSLFKLGNWLRLRKCVCRCWSTELNTHTWHFVTTQPVSSCSQYAATE